MAPYPIPTNVPIPMPRPSINSVPGQGGGFSFGSLLNPFRRGSGSILADPNQRLALGAALLSGRTGRDQFGNFAQAAMIGNQTMGQERKAEQERQKKLQFLTVVAPEYAQAAEAGYDPDMLYQEWMNSRKGSKPTSDISEYEFAKQQGFQGSFMDYQKTLRGASANKNYGTIPQGYMLKETPEGMFYEPIPGGPADTSQQDARARGQADVASRVVTDAAARAREAAGNRQFGGYGQGVVENIPWTDSAEVARQVNVLKSNAKVENLNAMRAASPTGGALGSVTEKEADMLAAKSGALDPSSPTFLRDLDDYERTLLQIIHGPQEGERIYQATRGSGQPGGGAAQPNTTSSGVQWSIEN